MKSRRPALSKFTCLCLGLFIDEHMRETIMEDMEDRYAFNKERNGLFLSGMIWTGKLLLILMTFFLNSCVWRMIMFINYLKITLRNIRKHKGYSIINIAGLAVGIACTIIVLLWVRDEVSFDRFHDKADQIYRVVCSTNEDGSPTNANGSFGIGPALKRDFPEVIETVRIRKMGQGVERYIGYKNKKFYESGFFFTEPSIFAVFDFPLVRGDSTTALNEPNSMVLTEEMAKKYFGDEDPIGKAIEADPYNDGNLMLFRITGIAKNVPRKSHFHFDFLGSYSSQKEDTENFSGFFQHFTYLLLNSGSSFESLNSKLLDFIHRNWRKDPWYTISLQPLIDIHLHSRLNSEIEPTGSILYVYLFTAIALFVLAIACINFMNLTTARAIKRGKEVGIRKVVGARKKQLVHQFLGESFLLSLFSAVSAILVVVLTLPLFNRLTGKEITLFSLANPTFVLGTTVIALAVGFLSGIYPAFFLSAFQPVNSLKSRTAHSASGAVLRKGLVIFQFTLSIGIIFGTLIVHKQMKYIQSRNLGYDKEQIMVIPLNKDLRQNYEGFRNELLKYPGIENITTSSYVPTRGSAHRSCRFEGNEDNLSQVIYFVDKEFVSTYGLTLLAGKSIRLPLSKDGTSEFLVSELTTREAGYPSPDEAVGKSVNFYEYKGHIAGVVKDINIYSLHRQPYSISYMVTPINNHDYLSIRIIPQNISETLGILRKTWQEMIPAYPLDYFFLDTSFEQMHISDKKMSEVFSIFSVLAIFVACMGLFGLAAYTAEQKTKEIGVRKILGASASSIYMLLSMEFCKWVVLANIIAWPLAYYAMHKWLQNFAFRINIGWEIFLISGAVALAISVMTVSFQSIKATTANPVDSLRYE
jgi:putative ABC transport system permease protein